METILRFVDVNVDGCGTDVETLAVVKGNNILNSSDIAEIQKAICDYKRSNEGEWDTDGCLDVAKTTLEKFGYEVSFLVPNETICF